MCPTTSIYMQSFRVGEALVIKSLARTAAGAITKCGGWKTETAEAVATNCMHASIWSTKHTQPPSVEQATGPWLRETASGLPLSWTFQLVVRSRVRAELCLKKHTPTLNQVLGKCWARPRYGMLRYAAVCYGMLRHATVCYTAGFFCCFGGFFLHWLRDVTRASDPPVPCGHRFSRCILLNSSM